MADFEIRFIVSREQSAAALAAEIAAYKATAKEADVTAKKAAGSAKEEATARKQAAKEVADAQKAAAREVIEAQKKVNAEFENASAVGLKFVGVLGQIGASAVGINGLASVVGLVADSFERAKNNAIDAGKFAEEYRKTLKELAFLKGEPGATSPIVRADLEFRRKTLQDQSGARSLQEEFRNVAGISMDTKDTRRKISVADAEAGMVYAGQQQAQYGGEGGAYGKLAGIIPRTEKADRVTADDVKRRMYQLSLIGQAGGASPSQFAGQMAGSAYLTTTGAYKDFARQAAIGSALSIETPSEIGTGLDQLHRLSTGSLRDMTAPPGSDMSPADYLKGIGANDQMDDLEIFQRMFRDVENAEDKARRKGEKLNLTTYLKSRGYENVKDLARFGQLYAARKDVEGTLLPQADKLPTLEEAEGSFAKFKATQSGLQQRSAVDSDRAKFSVGGGAMEYYSSMQQQAYNTINAEPGGAWGTLDDYKKGGIFSSNTSTLDARGAEILREEGIKKGLDWKVTYDTSEAGAGLAIDPLSDLSSGTAASRASAFYRRAQEVAQAGGDTLGANSDIVRRMEESLKRSADALDRSELALRGIRDKLDPPAVAPVRPGGANALPVR